MGRSRSFNRVWGKDGMAGCPVRLGRLWVCLRSGRRRLHGSGQRLHEEVPFHRQPELGSRPLGVLRILNEQGPHPADVIAVVMCQHDHVGSRLRGPRSDLLGAPHVYDDPTPRLISGPDPTFPWPLRSRARSRVTLWVLQSPDDQNVLPFWCADRHAVESAALSSAKKPLLQLLGLDLTDQWLTCRKMSGGPFLAVASAPQIRSLAERSTSTRHSTIGMGRVVA